MKTRTDTEYLALRDLLLKTEVYFATSPDMVAVEGIVSRALYSGKGLWTRLKNRFLTEIPSKRMTLDEAARLIESGMEVDEPHLVVFAWYKVFVVRLLQQEAGVIRSLAEDELAKAAAMLAAIPPGADMPTLPYRK